MSQFYERKDAARIMGVSLATLRRMEKRGVIRATQSKTGHKKVFIAKEDVEKHLLNAHTELAPEKDIEVPDVRVLYTRLVAAEETIGVLARTLGLRVAGDPRSQAELLLFYDEVIDLLQEREWSTQTMSDISDRIFIFTEWEATELIRVKGFSGLNPFIEIGKRMIESVEKRTDWPTKSLELLRSRMNTSLEKLYGLLYAASQVYATLDPKAARRAMSQIKTETSDLDRFIAAFLIRNYRKSE